MDYAIVRVPKPLPAPGGESAISITQGGGSGKRVTPGDVGDAITAILLVDDVARRADAAAAEQGVDPPKVPRVPRKVTMTVSNDESKAASGDQLSALVKGLAKLKED